ncbi:MAG: hypothetical protein K9J17_15135 [Flavobacteriales bacterium]|nr:hypothetical protein [Flavobacteriales bacterium]
MKSNANNTNELVLEVVKDGFRRLVYRTYNSDGSPLFLEESDLEDFSRPISDSGDFNVFFTERAFWRSLTAYTSNEGVLNRSVWHQPANEWLDLQPVFIHADIKDLVQQSLAEVTRQLSSNNQRAEGLRVWLRKLAQPTTQVDKVIANPSKKYRYAV